MKAGELAGSDAPVSGTSSFPANLTPDSDTGIGGWTDEHIIRAIRSGYDDENEQLCPTMPRFAQLSDDDAKSIALFLRSIPPAKHGVPESVCPPIKSGHDGNGGAHDGGT
jgi:hypothetical protein